jgi:hypothetical protein
MDLSPSPRYDLGITIFADPEADRICKIWRLGRLRKMVQVRPHLRGRVAILRRFIWVSESGHLSFASFRDLGRVKSSNSIDLTDL